MTEPVGTLLVEGWRDIPHSYAVANSFQCLEILKRPGVHLLHRDVPYILDTWRPMSGLFDPDTEARIRSIPAPAPDDRPDAVLRMAFPHNFNPSHSRRTVVFGTCEFGCLPLEFITGGQPLPDAMQKSDAILVTCSRWSRDGYLHSGADPDRVKCVPLGVDTQLYHPLPLDQRAELRRQMGSDGFVFLSLGAMTENKGMPLLFKAFARVAQRHPQARLVTKGLGTLYSSRDLLRAQMRDLSATEIQLIQPRLNFTDTTLSFADMARMYQAADAYVSPYSAEGFNMPVLESAACGLPSICTQGGSTDDFTRPDFSLAIRSTAHSFRLTPRAVGRVLKPDLEHLVELMNTAIEQPEIFTRAREAGPAFVAQGFTWKHVVDQLLELLFPRN